MTHAEHYPTCHSNYPEKLANEKPRALQFIDLEDGEWVKVCVDCGATIESCLK